MKINIKIIIKTLLLILAIFLIFFLIGIYNIKDRLLQDRKVDSNINEGDYILTRLTSNYEEYLKRKKKELETEKVNLFSEKTIQKSSIEKQRIAIRLSEIEKEKKVIEEEIKKNLEEKRGKEADLSILNKVYKAYEKVLFEKNEDYLKLFKEKEQLESYWRDYVNDIFVFFTEEYEKDLSKKAKIEDRFKIDNGKKYIFEEYDNLLKLSKLKVKEQEEFVDNKKEIIKIEEIAKSTEIKKETSKPETVKKIKDYKYFCENTLKPSTSDEDIIKSFAEPILKKIENHNPDFIDDFSSNTGWDYDMRGRLNKRINFRKIEDGKLKIYSGGPNNGLLTLTHPKIFIKNFVFKADAKVEIIDGYAKIHFYTNILASDSYYIIEVKGRKNNILLWTSKSSYVVIYNNPNKKILEESINITLIVYNNYISIYIDNKPVWFHYNKEFEQGNKIGLGGNSQIVTYAHVASFDNIKIWDLDKILP